MMCLAIVPHINALKDNIDMSSSNLFMIDIEGTALSEMERTIIKHPNIGSVILFTRNFKNPQQLGQLIADIREINPHIFMSTDHEGGFVQRFLRQGFRSLPAARVYGDTYDLNPEVGILLARQYGEIMAQDLLNHGIDLGLAPILDLHEKSLVIAQLDRAFHYDPEVIIALAGAFIEGMNTAGMPSIGKHFPGHGSVSADSHTTMPISHASMIEIRTKDLKPFIELNKKGLLNGVMPAHVTYNSVDAHKPAGFSKIWLQDILRQEMQFKGLILSDCLSMTGADIGNLKTRTTEALDAGCDMLIVCHQPREILLELVQNLNFTQSCESALRISNFKKQMIRFSNPEKYQIKSYVHSTVETQISSQNLQFNTSKSV
jgi:beta-N-acetylhexosaminidase